MAEPNNSGAELSDDAFAAKMVAQLEGSEVGAPAPAPPAEEQAAEGETPETPAEGEAEAAPKGKVVKIGDREIDEDDAREAISLLERKIEVDELARNADGQLAAVRTEMARLGAMRDQLQAQSRDVALARKIVELARTDQSALLEVLGQLGTPERAAPRPIGEDDIRKVVRDETKKMTQVDLKARAQETVKDLIETTITSEPIFKGASHRFRLELFDEMGKAAAGRRFFIESSPAEIKKVFDEVTLKVRNAERKRIREMRDEDLREQAAATRDLPPARKTSGTPAPKNPASKAPPPGRAHEESNDDFIARMTRELDERAQSIGGF